MKVWMKRIKFQSHYLSQFHPHHARGREVKWNLIFYSDHHSHDTIQQKTYYSIHQLFTRLFPSIFVLKG